MGSRLLSRRECNNSNIRKRAMDQDNVKGGSGRESVHIGRESHLDRVSLQLTQSRFPWAILSLLVISRLGLGPSTRDSNNKVEAKVTNVLGKAAGTGDIG